MKKLLLIAAMIGFTCAIYSQNRKSILKEIRSYKELSYESASYTTDQDIMSLMANYFKEQGYRQVYDEVPGRISFTKKVTLARSMDPHYNGGAKYGHSYVKSIVMVYFNEQEEGEQTFTIAERNYNNYEPFRYYSPDVLGYYSFNVYDLHKYLYNQIYGELDLPEELVAKVDSYNKSRKAGQRKLVSGVDY